MSSNIPQSSKWKLYSLLDLLENLGIKAAAVPGHTLASAKEEADAYIARIWKKTVA